MFDNWLIIIASIFNKRINRAAAFVPCQIKNQVKYIDGSYEKYTTKFLKPDIAELKFGKISSKAYTGKALKPTVIVKDSKKKLLNGTDVSIAMGKGTDIAMDVAMVTLITSDLLLLPDAIRLSKQTVRLIYQNLFWAFIYNVIGIPLAAGVLFPINGLLLNPMLASAAMAFSSVSVVLNSLRLKFMK